MVMCGGSLFPCGYSTVSKMPNVLKLPQILSRHSRTNGVSPRKATLSLLRRNYTNRNLLSLRDRGLVSNVFPDQDIKFINLCNASTQTVYAGFDPTADSLHVGNLAVLMALIHSQRAGHKPIALIGGATGMIGDPSGKNSERPALTQDVVAENATKLAGNIMKIFKNHSELFWDDKGGKEPLPQCLILNNLDWYKEVSSVDFFSKVGRYVRISQMLSKTAVQSRLKSAEGMSFLEFSYQVFQAYDWYHLFETYKCRIQIGGQDQLGNIDCGHDLIRRMKNKGVYGVMVPLITSETGDKYGKSAGNAVWLDPQKTSPFEMYQFFLRSKDSEVERLLKIFTLRTDDEINALIRKHEAQPDQRAAQLKLAKDVTRLVHGDEGYQMAMKATNAIFSEDVDALASIPATEVNKLFQGTSTVFSEVYLEPGTTILKMALKAKCFDTEKDAMRIISAGGFSLNYRRISNFEEMIVPGLHILSNKISLARVGKRNYYVIKWNP